MKLLAGSFGVLAIAWLAGTILYFSRRKPFYSNIRQTISELGEYKFPPWREVAWYGFLPVGVLVWLFCASAWFALGDETIRQGLLLYSLVGLGYVGSAFFPCDPGAPLRGTTRNNIHVAFGIVQYLGGAAALYLFERDLVEMNHGTSATIMRALAFIVIAGLILMGQGWLARWRGVTQRVMETALFAAMPVLLASVR